MRDYDIKSVAQMLADRVEAVCEWLLPGGTKQSNEWRAGSVFGDEGESLGVHLAGSKAGIWRDFADDSKGGDLIDLICAAHNVTVAEAMKEAKEYLGIKEETPHFFNEKRPVYKTPSRPKCSTPLQDMYDYFAGRGISKATVDAFKVAQMSRDIEYKKEKHQNESVMVFPYFFDGELSFIKYRPIRFKHAMWTSKDSRPCLFGWQTMPKKARSCVIVEGEIDAMSFYEAGIFALSVPRGGGKDDKQDAWLESEWEHLQCFDEIYLALDMDGEGQKATKHIANRLGLHRCLIIDFGKYKDANEALQNGMDIGPNSTIWGAAKTLDPDSLRSAVCYLDEMYEYLSSDGTQKGYALPWSKTEKLVRLHDGETTIWAGINGHGKSQIIGHVAVNSMARGERWCIASMEFKPYKLLARMAKQITGMSDPQNFDRDALFAFIWDRAWMFDCQGTAKADEILKTFEFAYKRYGVTNFLVDSLAKCGFAEDDYNAQKSFVDKLSDFARDNNIQVHLVCHARKGGTEDDAPGKFDIKGTGALTDMVDNVFTVWRNKHKEERLQELEQEGMFGGLSPEQANEQAELLSTPDCVLNCVKAREGDWEGKISLWFDRASLQYLQEPEDRPVCYC